MGLDLKLYESVYPFMREVSERALPKYGVNDTNTILYVAEVLTHFGRRPMLKVRTELLKSLILNRCRRLC